MILKNKNIFFIGTTKFDGLDQSTSYNIARALARDNSIFYVDYPFTWKDYVKFKNTDQIKRRKPYFSPSSDGIIETDLPSFKVIITPPVLSINFIPEGFIYRSLLKLNEMFIARRIKKAIKKYNITDYILINSFNFHYPGIANFLTPTLTVYHCVDPMIIAYDTKHGIMSEKQLVIESDLVICTSKQLYLEKKQLNENTHFIPNAADMSHSSKVLDSGLQVNEQLSGLKRPIIGYIGTIERRLDYDMIKELAEKNRDKSFVFVGPQSREFVPEWFNKTVNIHVIGRIPHDQIPGMLKGFDIAIIPFKEDEVSKTIFPLKLFEYLGSGKPVIATNFNSDLEEFTRGTVFYCENADSFSDAIETVLKTDNAEKQQLRINVANENTWKKRTNQFAELINSNL